MSQQIPEMRNQPDEAQGLAELSVRTKIPVDKLPLRRSTDVGREDELRAAAKNKLLAMAGFTTMPSLSEATKLMRPKGATFEQAEAELHPVAEAGAPAPELSPEQAWLNQFKTRFDALPQLHQGVQWTDVEKTLKADPEAMRKLQLLDSAGFEMNVFGEKNGEIVFRTAQTDVTRIASKYRTIMADKKAQTDYPQYNVSGNAEEIALSLGVEVADPELYEQYRVQSGWVWLKTDAATRATGSAFCGYRDGLCGYYAYDHRGYGSFCAALRVKKA